MNISPINEQMAQIQQTMQVISDAQGDALDLANKVMRMEMELSVNPDKGSNVDTTA